MGDLIKIVGVQYAVNSNHVKGEDISPIAYRFRD